MAPRSALVIVRPAAPCHCARLTFDVSPHGMAALHRAVAALRIMGDDLDPSEVTALLGGLPTESHRKGDDIRKRPEAPVRLARTGMWRRDSTPTEPEDLAAQVNELLTGLTDDVTVWTDVGSRYRVDLFCGWFMAGGNEGVEIPAATLLKLGERGISLGLDIYGPNDED